MDKNIRVKRTIKNQDDLKTYLTKEKLTKFKQHINDFIAITKEVDKKILDLKNNLHYKHDTNTVIDEYDLNVLILALLK